jgi:hypothetical protein
MTKAFSHLPIAMMSLGIVVSVVNGKAWDKLLKGEIATLIIIGIWEVRPRGKVSTLIITPQKELPALTYFTTTIQIINKKSYKKE